MRLLVTSDIHYDSHGGCTRTGQVTQLRRDMEARAPDLVVLAGDLGHLGGEFGGCLAHFRDFPCPVGVLAGNHDVWRSRDCSSERFWRERLRAETDAHELVWLEGRTLRIGTTAVLGTMAWYDYSAAPPAGAHPPAFYASTKAMLNMDARMIDWPWSDVEFASELRGTVRAELARLEADPGIETLAVVTHVPLLEEQMWRKPGDERWEHGNAYFGNLTLGAIVRRCSKLRAVVSGHSHHGVDTVTPEGIRAVVVPADYRRPAFVEVQLP